MSIWEDLVPNCAAAATNLSYDGVSKIYSAIICKVSNKVSYLNEHRNKLLCICDIGQNYFFITPYYTRNQLVFSPVVKIFYTLATLCQHNSYDRC